MSFNCKDGYYYKKSLGECFQCADICNDMDKTGTSLKTCEFNCPGFLKKYIEDPTSGNTIVFLEIGLPILILALLATVALSGLLLYRRRNNSRRRHESRHDIEMQVIPQEESLTRAETGPGDEMNTDSGINTSSLEETDEFATSKLVVGGVRQGLSDHCGLQTGYLTTASDNTPSQVFY